MAGRLDPCAATAVLAAMVSAGTSLTACAEDVGRPPEARIELRPDQIGEDDGFQTPVTLDGAASADPVDHPDGAMLAYAWQILDDEFRLEPGSRTYHEAPVIRLRGDRPATVILTVTDEDGLTSTTTAHLRLTTR